MRTLRQWLFCSVVAATPIAMVLASVPAARASSISFDLSNLSLTTTSGGTVTFDGTVTNDSGSDLDASDFFFNFFGFDPSSVNPIQDLGLVDFLIPNRTTSADVALFDVDLGTVPKGSSFPVQVQLEDINSDLSAVQTVTVSVPGGVAAVPEPSSFWLLVSGVAGALIVRLRCSRGRERPTDK
jgi:hypothetical protein